MPQTSSPPFTLGSKSFDPENLFQDEEKLKAANNYLEKNDLRSAVTALFALAENDSYVYHAIASVTLAQVQQAILQGHHHGLHDWYKDGDGKAVSLICGVFVH
jgi:predicted negative regulator of RcsB-dependent stress response